MKLSEAIRRGCKFRPQGFGCRLSADGRTCALGAAVDGYHGKPVIGDVMSVFFLEDVWPEYPHTDIVTWNDDDRLTREEIADRLERRGL